MDRVQIAPKSRAGGLYFKSTRADENSLRFIDSGCGLLNCLCSGGGRGTWPLGRVVNLVGDSSAGKTLLAIEAAANFARDYPTGYIWYREAEGAFDVPYAADMGLPVKRVDFGPDGSDTLWDTVEDIFEDMEKCIALAKKTGKPGLYIVDSLDALTARAELKRKIDEGSYNMDKQKRLSQIFARLVRKFRETRICVIVISQVRENIGISFGKKYRRSGGKALEFYASLIVWLSHLGTEYKEIKKDGKTQLKRPIGINIRAKCTKNKVGGKAPNEVDFFIRFKFGVDDVNSTLEWLYQVGRQSKLNMTDKQVASVDKLPDEDYLAVAAKLRKVLYETWPEVEAVFEPKRSKYG